ncbi:hypothetical protein [Candidatus Clostridium stratigraminis]|uniref:Peptidase family S41 n=1 Tax=Candidatus Clostridium stratigraminis TaxID=3381661 RepID=A0ABW8T7H4_9CLOT
MAKLIKKKGCLLVIIALVVVLTGCNSHYKKVTSEKYSSNISTKQWIEDIDYLSKNLPKVHKSLYHSIKKEDFNKEIQSLKNDVPKLKDYEIKCRLSQIVASIGDAHTSLNLGFNNSNTYPLVLRWYNEDLRIVAADKEHKDILGKKLVSINSVAIDEIIKKVNSLISHENDQWLKVMNVQYVLMPDVLKLLGVTSDEKLEFTLKDDDNKISKIELFPKTLTTDNTIRVIDDMPVKPLMLQYNVNDLTERLYWYKYIAEDKILYFQYNQCIDKDVAQRYGYKDYKNYPVFQKFTEGLLNEITDKNIDKFVVDLRNNTGGDSRLMTEFVNKIAGIDKLKGKIYVIIGRETFSSGLMAAVDLMNNTKAAFYGEPSGGNVNGFGDIKNLVLPNSKLQLSYSTKYFSLSDKFNENFIPDVMVEQNFNDYKQGIDDVYEAIKSRR